MEQSGRPMEREFASGLPELREVRMGNSPVSRVGFTKELRFAYPVFSLHAKQWRRRMTRQTHPTDATETDRRPRT